MFAVGPNINSIGYCVKNKGVNGTNLGTISTILIVTLALCSSFGHIFELTIFQECFYFIMFKFYGIYL